MSTLEALIGKTLDEITDEELEDIVKRGRLAREDTPKRERKSSKKPTKSPLPDIDLDDFV